MVRQFSIRNPSLPPSPDMPNPRLRKSAAYRKSTTEQIGPRYYDVQDIATMSGESAEQIIAWERDDVLPLAIRRRVYTVEQAERVIRRIAVLRSDSA